VVFSSLERVQCCSFKHGLRLLLPAFNLCINCWMLVDGASPIETRHQLAFAPMIRFAITNLRNAVQLGVEQCCTCYGDVVWCNCHAAMVLWCFGLVLCCMVWCGVQGWVRMMKCASTLSATTHVRRLPPTQTVESAA
jgi:hypothetical protein